MDAPTYAAPVRAQDSPLYSILVVLVIIAVAAVAIQAVRAARASRQSYGLRLPKARPTASPPDGVPRVAPGTAAPPILPRARETYSTCGPVDSLWYDAPELWYDMPELGTPCPCPGGSYGLVWGEASERENFSPDAPGACSFGRGLAAKKHNRAAVVEQEALRVAAGLV